MVLNLRSFQIGCQRLSGVMPSSQTRQIWDSGIPLANAWLELANDEKRIAHDELPGFAGALTNEPSKPSSWSSLAGTVLAATTASKKRRDNEERMKEDFLEALFNNEFIATGYIRSASSRPAPIIISADTFNGDESVDWTSAIISNFGVTYDNVRVTEYRDAVARPAVRMGRPGSGVAINAAIDELMLGDASFCTQDRKIAFDQIRTQLNSTGIKQSGLSDPNLAKYVVRKCGPKLISNNN